MSPAKFVQIHTLTSYPASLLNRDDAGFAKRLPFGGVTRTRVSSQCLKYHWRHHEGQYALRELEKPQSVRSRHTFGQLLAQPLVEQGYPSALVTCVVRSLMEIVLSGKRLPDSEFSKLLKSDDEPESMLRTPQVTVLGDPEIRYLKSVAVHALDQLHEDLSDSWDTSGPDFTKNQTKHVIEICKSFSESEMKRNLHGLGLAAGIDAALFGRMATSDLLAIGDAAIHVSHSFTTHEEEAESDYFSAVDELVQAMGDGAQGSGHINTSELMSGLFYGYVVVDVPLLVSNLEGCPRSQWEQADRALAADVVERLIHIIATVSPGAKLGSTAPYARSECVLIEAGTSQPRTLANAFRTPVSKTPDLLCNTYQSLAQYVEQMDFMYSSEDLRCISAMDATERLLEATKLDGVLPLAETASWAATQVRG